MNIYNEGVGSIDLEAALYSGDSYLQVAMTENDNQTLTYYKFNGNEYEEFDGTITDSELTSMSRFLDINTINQRNNNVCTRCDGTGVEVCKLCGGTGTTNMGEGFECNCIRTYRIEMESGYSPHPPKRWTCPRCNGTGEFSY